MYLPGTMEGLVRERIFEILVRPDRRGYWIQAATSSAKVEETSQLPKTIRNDIVELQSALLRGTAVRSGKGASQLGPGADHKILEEIGGKLYSFLFTGRIGPFYHTELQKAVQDGEALRIRLRVDDAGDLSRIPWETLYDVRTRIFLSAELRTLFTRAAGESEPVIRKPKRLHILGMIAGPTSFLGVPLARLDVDKERSKIEQTLEPLRAAGKLSLSWTIAGTYNEFRRRLRTPDDPVEGWTIFHFIGHGDFNETEELGFLIFEEAGGFVGEARYPDTLVPLLTTPHGPQLVVLNACNGARSSVGDLFSSTAAALALAEVPAVIAMQFPVSDAMAIAFSKSFYEYLSEGYSIHEALAQTRIDLRGQKISEWISPVLYMQSKEGQIVEL
jgi:hypothetical protein